MATQADNAKTASTRATQLDQYVNRQLRKTTRQVRFSDIVTGLLAIGAYVLAFFLVAAVVDAWVWPLSPMARGLALVVFVTGLLAIIWYALLPLFLRKINPQYAARMIEDGRPGFKNSLLNYLALKRGRQGVHRAILNEVSKRAATDLSTVTIDSAVDKTNVIRAGFLLVGLVAICVAYLIFSPKNPLPTVMRVLAPGSRIARPAAVRIQNVTPGDTSVFFGERQQITAQIVGNCDENDVQLVYSSKDQQIVDARIPMQPAGSHATWSAVLETGPAGIQQALDYYIVARDGVSPTYSIDVRPNPSITVNSIEITPPAYTKLPARTIEGSGEVQAVEGSNVEISATANLPIEVAYLVPLVARDDSPESTAFRELRSIAMKSEGTQANGRFTATLNANRDRALFTHYKIKFRSRNDYENEQANTYPVRVIADLAPEVYIVQPMQKEIAIPANQPFRVEIRASDLDYEISSVDLHIDHQGTQILDRNLHLGTDGQDVSEIVQVTATLTPADLNLGPGDQAIMFATASDNRISPSSQLPDPNVTRTENYTLIITEPIENPEPVKPESAPDEASEPTDDADRQASDQEQGQPSADAEPSTSDSDEESKDDSGDQDQASDSRQPDSATEANEQAQSQGSGSSRPSDSGNQSREQSGGQSGSDGDQSESTASDSQDGSESSTGSQSDGSESSSQDRSGAPDGQSGETQNRGGTEGRQQETEPDSATQGSSDANSGQQGEVSDPSRQTGQDGNNQTGQSDGDGNRDDSLRDGQLEPLSENASEGEQFERLKQLFDQQSRNRDGGGDTRNSRQPENAADQESRPPDQSNPENSATPGSENPQTENQQTENAGNQSSSAQKPDGGDGQSSDAGQTPQRSKEQTERDDGGNDSPSESSGANDASRDRPDESGNPENSSNQGNAQQEAGSDGKSDPSTTGENQSNQASPDKGQPQADSQTGDTRRSGGQDEPQADSPSSSDSQQPETANSSPSQSQSSTSDSANQSQGTGSDNQTSQPANQGAQGSEPESGDSNQDSTSSNQESPSSSDQTSGSSEEQRPSESNQQTEPSGAQSTDSGQPSSSKGSNGQPASADSEPAGDQPSGQSDSSSAAMNDATDSQRDESDASSKPGDSAETGGTPGRGGQTGTDSGQSSEQPTDPEEANLEYTKKVTDLVLNRLEEQKFEPDQELLDQMNWTRQDLERFLQQWQKMKTNARSGDAEAQRVYEEALRSLGLARETRGRQVDVKQDDPFQLNEDGAVDQIPAEYVDKFNSFLKRRNRAKRGPRP